MNSSINFFQKKNNSLTIKKFFFITILLCIAIMPIFADSSTGIDAAVNKVKTFLGSGSITTICLIALVVEGIGVVVMGKQGADIQAIISKFAPWIVGTVVLLSANGICDYFLKDMTF